MYNKPLFKYDFYCIIKNDWIKIFQYILSSKENFAFFIKWLLIYMNPFWFCYFTMKKFHDTNKNSINTKKLVSYKTIWKHSIAITISLTITVFVFHRKWLRRHDTANVHSDKSQQKRRPQRPAANPRDLGHPNFSQLNPQIRVHWHELHT